MATDENDYDRVIIPECIFSAKQIHLFLSWPTTDELADVIMVYSLICTCLGTQLNIFIYNLVQHMFQFLLSQIKDIILGR